MTTCSRSSISRYLRQTLDAAGVTFGFVGTIDEALHDRQMRDAGAIVPTADGKGEIVSSPFSVEGAPKTAPRPAPAIGEHTDELLRGIRLQRRRDFRHTRCKGGGLKHPCPDLYAIASCGCACCFKAESRHHGNEQDKGTVSRTQMNYRFVVPMMATAFFELSVISIVRVTTSYRAIELGLSAAWIGILTAAFAILPVFFALKVGRAIDRGNDMKMIWAGTVTAGRGLRRDRALSLDLCRCCSSPRSLGIGHLFLNIGLQVLCAQQPGPGVMERMLGNYMIATAIGQGAGPAVVGWVGGSAAIPPTQPLFWIGFATAVLAFICQPLSALGPPARAASGGRKARAGARHHPQPRLRRDLLRQRRVRSSRRT